MPSTTDTHRPLLLSMKPTILVYRFQRLFRAGDFLEDGGCGSGPDERLGAGIVLFEVGHDRGLQLGDAVEGATADAFVGDFGEEAFDQVEPGRRGRGEVQMEARMRG